MPEKINTELKVFWAGLGIENAYSGIGTHAHALRVELEDSGVKVEVLSHPNGLKKFFSCIEKIPLKNFVLPYSSSISLKHQLNLLSDKKVIFHALSNTNLAPLGIKKNKEVRYVLTVHDVIPLLEKAQRSPLYKKLYYMHLKKSLDVADAVVCVSQWAKKTLLDFFPDIKSKTTVIANGIVSYQTNTRKQRIAKRLLFVSRYEPYKNFHKFKSIIEQLPEDYSFDLVSDTKGLQWFRKNLAHIIRSNSSRINFFEKLSYKQLNELYLQASLFIHTSEYEGFCLPAAEAASNGCPVIYQSGSGIDEVVADRAGLALSASASIQSWCEAIEKNIFLHASSQWQTQLKSFLSEQPNWHGSALALKSLYNSL